LAQAHLAELDLSDNALGPIGMEGLVQFLKSPVCYSLKTLRLNNNGLGIYGGRVIYIKIEIQRFFCKVVYS
jgi:Ran GTPase-activating protein 1